MRILSLIAAAVVSLSLAGAADAAACKDPATGKFIKCAAAAPATPAASSAYTLDAKGRCHDASGKMAKKAMCAGQTATTTTSTTAPATNGGAVTTRSSTTTTSVATNGGPHCTKGKRCGNACISVKDVCHKQ